MAKLFLIQRKNSKSTKFLRTDPSKGKFLWTEDPNLAYRFDEQDVAEEWMEDDNVGGTDVVRLSAAIKEYGNGPEEDEGTDTVEVKVGKAKRTPSLEDLAPVPRGKSAKRQPVKTTSDEEEAPAKKVAKKTAAPAKTPAKTAAPAKKVAVPAKKAAKTAPVKVAPVSGETKLTAMRLPLSLVDKFANLGGGNVSAGVRKMAEEYFARKK